MTSTCGFCSNLAEEGPDSPTWTVVVETDNFVAVPSVGALVPGWLLVLPKRHVLNLAGLGPSDIAMLDDDLARIASAWSEVFGPVAMFEHGPARASSLVGCGVDHAHMHLVPVNGLDMLAIAKRHLPALQWEGCPSLHSIERRIPPDTHYLYLRQPSGQAFLACATDIPSQAFRRALAFEQGRPHEYDWKRHPRLELVQETVRRAKEANFSIAADVRHSARAA